MEQRKKEKQTTRELTVNSIRAMEGEGNERKSVLLYRAEKLVNLFLVHQKLSDSHRVTVKNIAVVIRADVHSVNEYFSVNDVAPCVLEIYFALAN